MDLPDPLGPTGAVSARLEVAFPGARMNASQRGSVLVDQF